MKPINFSFRQKCLILAIEQNGLKMQNNVNDGQKFVTVIISKMYALVIKLTKIDIWSS